MRFLLALYLLIPAIVYSTIGIGHRSVSLNLELLKWLPANYAYLALPHLLWLGFTLWVKPRPAFVHAGYVGATSALVALHIAFEFWFNNHNSLGWIFYYPAAGIAMAALCLLVKQRAAMAELS
jgi:hypothetical protein